MARSLIRFISILLFTSKAYALTCEVGKIRSTTDYVDTVITGEYCYNSDFNQLYSKSCENKKCTAFQSKEIFTIQGLNTKGVGTPGFKLCRLLNGKPEIVDFWAQGEWQPLDRCNFDDGYVDTGSLYKYYLNP